MKQQAEAKKPFFYGYVVVALAFIIQAVLAGTSYTFSVFFKPLAAEFDWTRAVTSGAFSLYMLLHGVLFIVTGRLNDKVGTRIVMTGCGLFMGVGYLLMSQISNIWHLYLYFGVIIAIGMSGGFVPVMSTVTRWFIGHKRRGLMIGIALAGGGFGTMIMPPIAAWLISSFGWQDSYKIIGVMVLVVLIAAAQFIRRAPEPARRRSAEAVEELIEEEQRGFTLGQTLRTKQFWLICAAYFGFGLLLQGVMVHIVLYATGQGIPDGTAASIFIAIGAMSVAGRIVMGVVIDRLGNKSVLVICFTMMTAALLWLLIADQAWMLFIFAVFFGFAYGGLVSAQNPLIADSFGMTAHGAILGVLVSVITFGAAVGPVVSGAIYDSTGKYFIAFLITAGFAAAGLIISLFLKPIVRGGTE